MSKPTVSPDFATDASYAAGGNPWSGQPNKVDPGAIANSGFVPQQQQAAEHVNYKLNAHGQWIRYLDGFSDWEEDYEEFLGANVALTYNTNGMLLPTGRTYFAHTNGQITFTVSELGGHSTAVLQAATNATTSIGISGTTGPLATTDDYYAITRLRVQDRAKLNTNVNNGIIVCHDTNGGIGFRAGSTLSYWEVLKPNAAVQAPSVQVAVATGAAGSGVWQQLRVQRIGGTITWYVDGTAIYTMSDSTASNFIRTISIAGIAPGSSPYSYAFLDFQRLRVYRPVL